MNKVLNWIVGGVTTVLLIVTTIIFINNKSDPYTKLNNDLFDSILEYDGLVDDLKSKVNGQDLFLIDIRPEIKIDESSRIEMLSISLSTTINERIDIVQYDKVSKFNLYAEESDYRQLTFDNYLSCCKDIFVKYECDIEIYGSFELAKFVDTIKGKDVVVYENHSFNVINDRVEGDFLKLDILLEDSINERIYLKY